MRAGPAAGAHRAPPAQAGGPVPGRGSEPRDRTRRHPADARQRPRRQHLRPGLPGVSRQPRAPVGLSSWRSSWQTLRACYGIGRGARAKIVPLTLAALALIPAIVAVGIALLIAQAGPGAARFESLLAHPVLHVCGRHRGVRDAVLRGAGTRAVRAGPALRGPAAVLLAGAGPDRLRRGADRGTGRGAAR